MDRRVILAVAGAGKTYTLCHSIDITKRNLIIAFTKRNIANIENELLSIYGEIPKNTRVMTFHSFVYQFAILPYEPTILNSYERKDMTKPTIQINGVTMHDPEPRPTKIKPNKKYVKNCYLEHYIKIYNKKYGKYYCALLSELVLKTKSKTFIKKISARFLQFFDTLYIDEFQDFREKDFDFLIKFLKNLPNVLLVGDFYQHSVNAKNNCGKPFESNPTYKDYILFLQKNKFQVDNTSLIKSRRCPKDICNFVSQKLKIDISFNNNHHGKIKIVTQEDILTILGNDSIKKILYSESNTYKFNAINWGYSKGDTYDNICVILTDTTDKILNDDFNIDTSNITPIVKNKLYVALTRTKGDLYIITKKLFDEVKNEYKIK